MSSREKGVLRGLFLAGVVALVLCPVAVYGAGGRPEVEDVVIAHVGTETIMGKQFNMDLQYRWQKLRLESGRDIPLDLRFRKQVLEELINGLLIRFMAEDSGITATSEEIEAAWVEGRQLAGSEEAYQAYLKKQHLDEAALRRALEQRIITQKWIEEQTAAYVVSEAELEEEYAQWEEEGLLERKVKTADIAYILLHADPERDKEGAEAARERIEGLRERILGGEDFCEVAKAVSEDSQSARYGGMYYESAPGLVPKAIEERMFSLPIGAVSEPFLGKRGWQLIKVIGHNEPGVIPLAHVRDKLSAQILARKRHAFLTEKLSQARIAYRIEIVHESLR